MSYRLWLSAFVLFLGLTLLTLVDFRRGFIFAAYPVRSVYYVFHPAQLAMLAVGVAGAWFCQCRMRRIEAQVSNPSRYLEPLTIAVAALLVADLFTYRGVPAARSVAAGRIGVDWLNAFGVTGWPRPIAQATSYLPTVWHAAMLGILLSGLALTILPLYFRPYVVRSGFPGSLFGALFALPQPFCSCCSSVMAPSLVRRGASTQFLLSFVVGAPMLNITTMILAVALLPAPFALVRIVAGVVVTVVVTYLVARAADRWSAPATAPDDREAAPTRMQRALGWYAALFDLDRITGDRRLDAPSQLLSAWLYASVRVGMVLIPTLWVWSVIASAVYRMLPPAFGNNLPSVVLSAIGGTLLMISTWSEIPMALELIQSGFTGPAAALLIVLPAVSLPCMMLLGGSLQRFRLVGMLSAAVMLIGIAAGVMFL